MEKKKLLRSIIILTLLVTKSFAAELDDLIKSQELMVNKNFPQAQEFIIDANKNAAKLQARAELIIKNSKSNAKKNFNFDCLDELKLENPPSPASNVELYIFVSLSMAQTRLIEIIKEAAHYNGIVVLRGLKNNSYQETANFLQPIIKAGGSGFIIDPTLFTKFNITKVPVFVLNNPIMNKYDRIAGNITLNHALKTFAKHGDLKEKAAKILGDVKCS